MAKSRRYQFSVRNPLTEMTSSRFANRLRALLFLLLAFFCVLFLTLKVVEGFEQKHFEAELEERLSRQLEFQTRWLEQQASLREQGLVELGKHLFPGRNEHTRSAREHLDSHRDQLLALYQSLVWLSPDNEATILPVSAVNLPAKARVLIKQSSVNEYPKWSGFYQVGQQWLTDLSISQQGPNGKLSVLMAQIPVADLLVSIDNANSQPGFPSILLVDQEGKAGIAKNSAEGSSSFVEGLHKENQLTRTPWRIVSFYTRENLENQPKPQIGLLVLQITLLLFSLILLMYLSRRSRAFSRLIGDIDHLDKAQDDIVMFQKVIENSRNLVAIIDVDGKPDYVNRHFTEFSAYTVEDFSETPAFSVLMGDGDFLSDNVQNIRDSLQQSGQWQGEYKARKKDGSEFWMLQSISVLKDPGKDDRKEAGRYACSGRDITQYKEQQLQMEKLAYYDPLTGIQNRTLFKEQIAMALRVGEREGGQSALLYLDLDHFKRINDSQGHEAGDELLIEVAARLKDCLRDEDPIGRLGGDEFGVLLTRIGSPQYASIVANKLLDAIAKPVELQGKEVIVSSSIGITIAPHDGKHVDKLMKNADLAMYQAKDKGRNNFRFYTSDMNIMVENRMEMENDLREALHKQQFSLHYQPQVDLITGEIVGAEALIRWQHPQRGYISPVDFICVAEETGLIVPIGKWVLRTAAQQAKSIQKALKTNLKMSVNLSARQLTDGNFIDTLAAVIQECRIDPALLELEVTESMLMDNINNVISQLTAIRELGVSLAIDDFGTGYSSLSYLKQLPVDILKIDRSFVKDLPDDLDDREITSLIITLANKLDRKVIAEGVETIEQIEFLKEHNCDYGQGYFYSRPVPADEFIVLLYEWGKKDSVKP